MDNRIETFDDLVRWAEQQHSGGVEYVWSFYSQSLSSHFKDYEISRITYNPPFPETQGASESWYLSKELASKMPPYGGRGTASQIVSFFDKALGESLQKQHLELRKCMDRNFIQKRIKKFEETYGEPFEIPKTD